MRIFIYIILYSYFFLINSTIVADDLYSIQSIPDIIDKKGFLNFFHQLLFNSDIYSEYRNFSFSRIFQALIIMLSNGNIIIAKNLFAVIILFTHFLTLLSTNYFLTIFEIDKNLKKIILIILSISPFTLTYAFWHYSYFLLPYQIAIIFSASIFITFNKPFIHYISLFIILMILSLCGESHLLFLILLLLIVFKKIKKINDFYLSVFIILSTIFLHYIFWKYFSGGLIVGKERYLFEIPNFYDLLYRTLRFFKFYFFGFYGQLSAISSFNFFYLISIIFLAICFNFLEVDKKLSSKFSLKFLALLFIIFISSFFVVYSMSVSANWAVESLWRRYGYFSYTLLYIIIFYLICTTQKKILINLFLAYLITSFSYLVVIKLPETRKYDKDIINKINLISSNSLILINHWERQDMYGNTNITGGSDGIRTVLYPEIYESSYNSYWWMSEYIINFSNIKNIGSHISKENEDFYLVGNGVLRPSKLKINLEDLSVLVNLSTDRNSAINLDKVKIYKKYIDYFNDNYKLNEENSKINKFLPNKFYPFDFPIKNNSDLGYLSLNMDYIYWMNGVNTNLNEINNENKIVGFWKINDENCLIDHIEGNRYLIINERNNKFYGEFDQESLKIIIDNNLVGNINDSYNRIIWNNGSIWNR